MIYIVTNNLKQIELLKPVFSFIKLFKSESKLKIYNKRNYKNKN